MKKILYVFLVALVFSACGDGTEQDKLDIVIVSKGRTPYWDNVELGAKSAGEQFDVSVRFLVPTEEAPASWQIRTIEELITKPPDGIAFAASDPKSLTPVILKAMQLGIPCVAFDTDVETKARHVYIGTGDYQSGQQAGEYLLSLLGNKGKIAVVSGFFIDNHPLKRVRGFRDILAEYPNVEIIASIEKEDAAVEISDVESLLASYPDLAGIFCASDSDGLIAAEAIQKSDESIQVKIVSVGESPDLMKYVQDGVIDATIARKPYKMGYLIVLVLHSMAKAGIQNALRVLPVPESGVIDTGTYLVTPTNIMEYREEMTELGIKTAF